MNYFIKFTSLSTAPNIAIIYLNVKLVFLKLSSVYG